MHPVHHGEHGKQDNSRGYQQIEDDHVIKEGLAREFKLCKGISGAGDKHQVHGSGYQGNHHAVHEIP